MGSRITASAELFSTDRHGALNVARRALSYIVVIAVVIVVVIVAIVVVVIAIDIKTG